MERGVGRIRTDDHLRTRTLFESPKASMLTKLHHDPVKQQMSFVQLYVHAIVCHSN
jgi:hypothetical protein